MIQSASHTSLRAHEGRYLLYACENYAFPILRPVCEEIQRRGGDVRWFVQGCKVSSSYLGQYDVRCSTVEEVKRYAPTAVITPNNTVPHFFPGLKVQIFHGFNARKRTRGARDSHFAIRGFFDLYCTQGPSTTEVFRELEQEHGHFRVVETGWPKMDSLFAPGQRESDTGEPQASDAHSRPTILLTSTFSKNLSCALPLFDTVKQLVARNDRNWMVQFHPKMDEQTVKIYQEFSAPNYQFIDTSNVMPFLQKADLMVCDTSSILQEFMQLNRPVVTYRNRTPGPWLIDIQQPEELDAAIDQGLSRPVALMAAIQSYNQQLHPYSDGKSSARVLDAIDECLQQGGTDLAAKPWNIVRKFKLRRELRYWGL